jgi:uncharacterized protein YkwD
MKPQPMAVPILSFALTLCVVPAFACSPVQSSTTETEIIDASAIDTALLNQNVIKEINSHRCENGLPALGRNSTLEVSSKYHSDWMKNTHTFAHESTVPGMVNPWDRAQHFGYKYRQIAENLALFPLYDFRDQAFFINGTCKFSRKTGEIIEPISYAELARQVGVGWMNSPGHRANILLDGITEAGVAITIDETAEHCGTIYITMMYGTQAN